MKYNTIVLIGACSITGGIVAGIMSIIHTITSKRKIENICDKLGTTIDDVSKDVDVNIDEKIVEAAIEKAVYIKSRRIVDEVSEKLRKDIRNDMNTEIRSAVRAIYPDIRKSCTEKVTSELSKINVKDLTNVIREDAKEKVVEKFNGELDDIIDKFNNDLDNVTKIYSSISKRFTGTNSGNGSGFNISLN